MVHTATSSSNRCPWGSGRPEHWGDLLAFIRAVIARVREVIGPRPVVGLRLCLDDFLGSSAGGIAPEDVIHYAREFVAGGVWTT